MTGSPQRLQNAETSSISESGLIWENLKCQVRSQLYPTPHPSSVHREAEVCSLPSAGLTSCSAQTGPKCSNRKVTGIPGKREVEVAIGRLAVCILVHFVPEEVPLPVHHCGSESRRGDSLLTICPPIPQALGWYYLPMWRLCAFGQAAKPLWAPVSLK